MFTRIALSLRWRRGGLRGEVREHGRIANTPTALDRLLGKLGGDGTAMRFCYEAGPCG